MGVCVFQSQGAHSQPPLWAVVLVAFIPTSFQSAGIALLVQCVCGSDGQPQVQSKPTQCCCLLLPCIVLGVHLCSSAVVLTPDPEIHHHWMSFGTGWCCTSLLTQRGGQK